MGLGHLCSLTPGGPGVRVPRMEIGTDIPLLLGILAGMVACSGPRRWGPCTTRLSARVVVGQGGRRGALALRSQVFSGLPLPDSGGAFPSFGEGHAAALYVYLTLFMGGEPA
jgi:hypothetical protein